MMDAFSYRRAVPYVAAHLGVSRYTIYKYLDEVNAKQQAKGGCLTCSISLPSKVILPSRRTCWWRLSPAWCGLTVPWAPPSPASPLAPARAAALEAFLSLAQEWGLPGENLSGYVGTVDLNNQPDTALHILGHLDIVDAGEGWTVTAPFQPKVVDGLLYGRGTADDKGPMVAALLAMKAVRDLKLPLTKNVRLIAGTDEETGFRDIKWYYGSHPYAPHTLSPDADFPIINLEKGHYQPTFQAAWPQETALPRVAAFSGGTG